MQKFLVSICIWILPAVTLITGIWILVLTQCDYRTTTVGYILDADPIIDKNGNMTHVVFVTYFPDMKDTVALMVSTSPPSIIAKMEKNEGISFAQIKKVGKYRITGYISVVSYKHNTELETNIEDLSIEHYKLKLKEIYL